MPKPDLKNPTGKPVAMSVESSRPVLVVAPTVAKSSTPTLTVNANQQNEVTNPTASNQNQLNILPNTSKADSSTSGLSVPCAYKAISVKYEGKVRHFLLPVSGDNLLTKTVQAAPVVSTPGTTATSCEPGSQPSAVSDTNASNVTKVVLPNTVGSSTGLVKLQDKKTVQAAPGIITPNATTTGSRQASQPFAFLNKTAPNVTRVVHANDGGSSTGLVKLQDVETVQAIPGASTPHTTASGFKPASQPFAVSDNIVKLVYNFSGSGTDQTKQDEPEMTSILKTPAACPVPSGTDPAKAPQTTSSSPQSIPSVAPNMYNYNSTTSLSSITSSTSSTDASHQGSPQRPVVLDMQNYSITNLIPQLSASLLNFKREVSNPQTSQAQETISSTPRMLNAVSSSVGATVPKLTSAVAINKPNNTKTSTASDSVYRTYVDPQGRIVFYKSEGTGDKVPPSNLISSGARPAPSIFGFSTYVDSRGRTVYYKSKGSGGNVPPSTGAAVPKLTSLVATNKPDNMKMSSATMNSGHYTFVDSRGRTVHYTISKGPAGNVPTSKTLGPLPQTGTDSSTSESAPRFVLRKTADGSASFSKDRVQMTPGVSGGPVSSGVHMPQKPVPEQQVVSNPTSPQKENLSSLKIGAVFSLARKAYEEHGQQVRTVIRKPDQQVFVGKDSKIAQPVLQVQSRKDTSQVQTDTRQPKPLSQVHSAKVAKPVPHEQVQKSVRKDTKRESYGKAEGSHATRLENALFEDTVYDRPDFSDVEKFFDVMDVGDIENECSPPHLTPGLAATAREYNDVEPGAKAPTVISHSIPEPAVTTGLSEGIITEPTVSRTVRAIVLNPKVSKEVSKTNYSTPVSFVSRKVTVQPNLASSVGPSYISSARKVVFRVGGKKLEPSAGKDIDDMAIEPSLLGHLESIDPGPIPATESESVEFQNTPSGELESREPDTPEEAMDIGSEVEPPGYLDVMEIDPCKVVIRNISKYFPKQEVQKKTKKSRRKEKVKVDFAPVNIRKRPWSKFVREHLSSYYREEKFARLELNQDSVYKVLRESPLTVVAMPRRKIVKVAETVKSGENDGQEEKETSREEVRGPQTARKHGYGRLNSSRKNESGSQDEKAGEVVRQLPEEVKTLQTSLSPPLKSCPRPANSSLQQSLSSAQYKSLTSTKNFGMATHSTVASQNVKASTSSRLPKDNGQPALTTVIQANAGLPKDTKQSAVPRKNTQSISSTLLKESSQLLGTGTLPEKDGQANGASTAKGLNLGSCVTAGFTSKLDLPGKINDGVENYLILKTSTSCYYVPVGKNAYVVPLSNKGTDVTQSQTRPLPTVSALPADAVKTTNVSNVVKSASVKTTAVKEAKTTAVKEAKGRNKKSTVKQLLDRRDSKTESPGPEQKQNKTDIQIPTLTNVRIKTEPVTEGYPGDPEPPQISPAPSPVFGRRIKKEPTGSDTDSAPEEDDEHYPEEGVADEPVLRPEENETSAPPFQSVADLYRARPEYSVPVVAPPPREETDGSDKIRRLRNLLKSKEQSFEKTRQTWSGTDTKKLIAEFDNI